MSHKPIMYSSDCKYQMHLAKKEIQTLLEQLEDLEKWLIENIRHQDWEKMNRQRNNLQLKITVREQRIERQEYPARFQQEESPYLLTQNIR